MNIEESTGILSDERVATPSATSTLLASTSTHFFFGTLICCAWTVGRNPVP
jgi:hypothetical protein